MFIWTNIYRWNRAICTNFVEHQKHEKPKPQYASQWIIYFNPYIQLKILKFLLYCKESSSVAKYFTTICESPGLTSIRMNDIHMTITRVWGGTSVCTVLISKVWESGFDHQTLCEKEGCSSTHLWFWCWETETGNHLIFNSKQINNIPVDNTGGCPLDVINTHTHKEQRTNKYVHMHAHVDIDIH